MLISAFQGFVYTSRSALFMDICTPAVAATQFTAYLAMINLTIVYTSAWQGWCLANWGYPATLAIDAVLGTVSLPLLLLMTKPAHKPVRGCRRPRRRNPIMLRVFLMSCAAGLAAVNFTDNAVGRLPRPHYRPQESDPAWLQNAAIPRPSRADDGLRGADGHGRLEGRRCQRLLRHRNPLRGADGKAAGLLLPRRPASRHRRHDGKAKPPMDRRKKDRRLREEHGNRKNRRRAAHGSVSDALPAADHRRDGGRRRPQAGTIEKRPPSQRLARKIAAMPEAAILSVRYSK